jgi:8-oxo-dGTP pyrophosphatase MutT (NUDIX family)
LAVEQSPALRASAAVLLARDGLDDLELFMVRRPAGAGAFADVWVFPGGSVQGDDAQVLPGESLSADAALARLSERGGVPPGDGTAALALHRAAVRELFEEAGVLLARPGPDAALAAALRAGIRGGATLGAALAEVGLAADLDALVYFSHWITPSDRPRRFDTRFFVAALPDGQAADHCGEETCDGAWVAPREALGRYAAGDFPLVLPTRLHLQRLTPYRRLAPLLADAAAKPIRSVQPGRPAEPDDGHWWREGEPW